MLARLQGMRATTQSLKKELEEAQLKQVALRAKYEERAGEHIEKLAIEYDFALRLLGDKKASLRWAAIYSLKVHWLSKITEQVVAILVDMAQSDNDSEVRWLAIWIIGCYYSGTRNERICEFLRKIMTLEFENPENEKRAKDSIWLINFGK